MKYAFIGDIHGNVEAMNSAKEYLNKNKADRLIFVGDFLDSFDRSINDQFKTLDIAINLIEQKVAQCVYANHEFSYMYPNMMKASGFNRATTGRFIVGYANKIMKLFKPYILLNKILVTHAGVSKLLLEQLNIEEEDLIPALDEWHKDINSPYYQVGYARGGYKPYGGPLWCDYNQEFVPLNNYIQIFGHTHVSKMQKSTNHYNIDCINNPPYKFLVLEI